MDILRYIEQQSKYKKVINNITSFDKKNIYIGNASANICKMLAVLSHKKVNKNVVYVCENIYEATQAFGKISEFLPDVTSFYPVEELISSELVASSPTFRLARIETINRVLNNEKLLIVTTPEGLSHLVMGKEKLDQSVIKLHVNNTYPLRKLAKDLLNRGYKKVSITENSGTFSVRGSIIDVYPLNGDGMYRINYFDDEIETIKKVDIETQRSISHLEYLEIYPLYEIFYSEEDLETIIPKIKAQFPFCERLSGVIDRLLSFDGLDQMQIFTPFIDEKSVNLIDILDHPLVFLEKPNKIFDHETHTQAEISNYTKATGLSLDKKFFKDIKSIISNTYNVYLNDSFVSLNDIKLDDLLDLKTINVFNYNNNLRMLCEDIHSNLGKKTYIITHFDKTKASLLKEVFYTNNIPFNDSNTLKENEVNIVIDKAICGFKDLELNIECITPNEFSASKISKSTKFAKYYKTSSKVYNKDDIKPGDYVIHQNYGIGIYQGIETRNLRNHIIDFLSILYDKGAKVLVPVENIYLLEKYNVSNDVLPKLDNISSDGWTKRKALAKKKIEEMAKYLIKLQATRMLKTGFKYKEDTPDQIEFEKGFEYVETEDQLQAIKSVKDDMESDRPMDRLICGDVGFGKTEVAMRAAFKAVESGKQVAYLAPTTVLSRQHYYSFKERFEKFGVRVELLNRFVSKKDQKIVIDGIEKGYVDIVIGTHRILSEDLKFKDLGLLVIDEEQRFGVKHKERIKELKENIDVLTLTATPIPRTLQMSLNGLKDLSLIETAPVNRLPIQTYVLESNDSVLREAINRELSRDGQVFYLLNRIDELDGIVAKIHKLCPFAKVSIIHGQMDKDDIENELVGFLEGKFNVLVCTTIIETGIDIPNANTIIIDKAYLLGLSQLYQIRGRVGRSDKIAYAYLMYEPEKVLTQEARSRLDAIKEFTELGSGYKIALRDLSIRGAGDILGKEQSGFITRIGLELYSSMLNSALNELNGVVQKEETSIHYNISIDRHIDNSLVADDDIKINIHKEINRIKSREEINALVEDYTDRFGKLDDSIYIYMEEKYLEYLLKSKGVQEFKEDGLEVTITFDADTTKRLVFKELEQIDHEVKPNFTYNYERGRFIIIIDTTLYKKSYIFKLTKFLEKIVLH